jgi:hypothetical protein
LSLRLPAALILTFAAPLAMALEAQTALGRLLSFGAPALLLLAFRVAVTALGLIAGRLLWRGDDDGWRLVRLWSVAAALATAVTFLTPYFPSNRTPGEKPIALLAWMAVYAVWFVIAHRQTRLKAAPS